MIDRLNKIRKAALDVGYQVDGNKILDELITELIEEIQAKEAAQTPVKGQVNFYPRNEEGKLLDCKITDLENVIIHEGDISNGRKWYAISGILIEEE